MDIVVPTYVAYIVLSVVLTVWVAQTLHKNGRVFLIEVFHGEERLADSVNHLLVVGFYLINFGYVNVSQVDFISSGGTPHPGYNGAGTHFAMDNLVVTTQPQPPSIVVQPANQQVAVGGSARWFGGCACGGSCQLLSISGVTVRSRVKRAYEAAHVCDVKSFTAPRSSR